MGEGGCNPMLLSVNIVLTLQVVDTTSQCTPLAQVRHMYRLLY